MNFKKEIIANIFLAILIHIAFIMFLFLFRSSKPLPENDANILRVTVVNPKISEQETGNAKNSLSQTTQVVGEKQKASQNIEHEVRFSQEQKDESGKFIELSYESNGVADELSAKTDDNQLNYSQPVHLKALYMPKIPYPRAAKATKTEGFAKISYVVGSGGKVISVKVLEAPHVSFEKTIEKCVLSWRFAPVDSEITVTQIIVFKLTD